MLKVEQESAALLASICGEVSDLAQKVASLEGDVEDARQARDTAEVNFQNLSDKVAYHNRWQEDAEK
jgi:outer membrane murein-binding lipoprotein Lpp